MRRDCLGVMGHPVVETPNLDMMKRDGVMFTNAYCAVPSCIAARASLLTGLTQRSHGRVGYQDGVIWNYEHTLPGEFAKAGYHTQCVGKMHVHPARNLCGFHNVVLHDGYLHHTRNYNKNVADVFEHADDYLTWFRQQMGPEVDINDAGLECNSWVARPWPYAEHLHPTNWVVSQSVDFLRRKDPTKPFFLMASFVRPHSPLDPPKTYYDMYINQDIPKPCVGDWAEKEDSDNRGLYASCTRGLIGQKALKRARAAYYAHITHIDHQIGRLLQSLKEYGFLNNSVIVFTSDHGDLLGDHNLFRKALPYEGSAGIPLIVYDPGNILKCRRNRTIDKPVELRDIMPTLLDMASVEIPDSIEGKSVLPLIKEEEISWRDYIHGEHEFGPDSNHFLTNGREKYIWYSQTGREQFFNLVEDPEELRDLSGNDNYGERVAFWRTALVKELDGREEGYSDGKSLIVGREPKACLDHIIKHD